MFSKFKTKSTSPYYVYNIQDCDLEKESEYRVRNSARGMFCSKIFTTYDEAMNEAERLFLLYGDR